LKLAEEGGDTYPETKDEPLVSLATNVLLIFSYELLKIKKTK